MTSFHIYHPLNLNHVFYMEVSLAVKNFRNTAQSELCGAKYIDLEMLCFLISSKLFRPNSMVLNNNETLLYVCEH